jgi:DNA-binding response OmpR family regulator
MQGQKRILIIEDDVGFRNLLRIQLSLAGYMLEAVEDGAEAGKALLERPPDLVLSDLGIPFLNGFELLSLVRSNDKTASIPVILLSGRNDVDSVSKAMKLGAADFLFKPVKLEALLNSIQACLAKADKIAATKLQPD